MVLGSDLDPAVPAVLRGLIDPVMAELEFRRPASDRLTQDLMTQTDAEEGDLPQDRPDRFHDIREGRRVPGPVGEQNPVGPKGQDLLPRRRGRQDEDLAAPLLQIPEDVELDAAVEDHHPPPDDGVRSWVLNLITPFTLCPVLPPVGRPAGDFLDEIAADQARVGADAMEERLDVRRLRGQDAPHRPGDPDAPGQGTGVDPLHAEFSLRLEERLQVLSGTPVARILLVLPDDESLEVDGRPTPCPPG